MIYYTKLGGKNMKFVKWMLVLLMVFAIMQIAPMTQAAVSTSGIVGASNPHIWFDSEAYTALDAIKNNGFNTVRIVWQTSGSGSRLGQIISRCKALGLKPIPELHDITGGTGDTNGSNLDRMVQYWISVKSYVPSDVWINIANEWGPANSTVWRDAYINAIKTMRNAGFSNTIVVDSGGWGQDDQDILNYGPAILAADSNIVLSCHFYGSWNDNNKINTFLSSCQSKGLPIMIGEFGYNYNNGSNNLSCKVDAPYVVSTCKSKGIGYIGWSWHGNNSENAWLDMTSDWKTLNSWGNTVKGGGTVITPRPATPTPTLTPTPRPGTTPTPTRTATPRAVTTPTPGTGTGSYVVTYKISNDWGSGATIDVTIKNNTTAAVNGWTLAWTFPGTQKITNLWSGAYTQSGAAVTVKDAGYNSNIPANGGSVTFGFQITYSGANAKPTSITLNGTACQVQ
jgi:mannan endo-1,4-beta-mannosidase